MSRDSRQQAAAEYGEPLVRLPPAPPRRELHPALATGALLLGAAIGALIGLGLAKFLVSPSIFFIGVAPTLWWLVRQT